MKTKITKQILAENVDFLLLEKTKLLEKVALLEAQLKAAVPATFKNRGCTFAAVVLPCQVEESIREQVLEAVYRSFGDGDYLTGNYQQGGDYRQEIYLDETLPGYGGFVVEGFASRENGFTFYKMFGLVEIPHTCGVCKKPTMGNHNCKACSDAWEAEVEARNAEYAS